MKNQKFLWKKLISYCGLAIILSGPVYVKASDANTEEAKWFPVSVASIEDRKEILVNHNYKYDEKGNMIQSPVKLSDKVRMMVNDEEYLKKLEYLQTLSAEVESDNFYIDIDNNGSYFNEYFLCSLYGSDLACFCYTYGTDDKVYEYEFPLKSGDLSKYLDYFISNRTKEEILEKEKYFFEQYFLKDYNLLVYSDEYLVSVLLYKYFDEPLSEKCLELGYLDEADVREEQQLYEQYRGNGSNNFLSRYDYYYNYTDTFDVVYQEKNSQEEQKRVNTDKYKNSTNGEKYDYYNGYDEYGNLIYRVEYFDEVTTSEVSLLKDSVLTRNYKFKQEIHQRRIKQIDMYTYAYGNPAEYYSNPENFQISKCEESIADIVDIVGGTGFSNSYKRDTYFIEKANLAFEKVLNNKDYYSQEKEPYTGENSEEPLPGSSVEDLYWEDAEMGTDAYGSDEYYEEDDEEEVYYDEEDDEEEEEEYYNTHSNSGILSTFQEAFG